MADDTQAKQLTAMLALGENMQQFVDIAGGVRTKALAQGFNETEAGAMGLCLFQNAMDALWAKVLAETEHEARMAEIAAHQHGAPQEK